MQVHLRYADASEGGVAMQSGEKSKAGAAYLVVSAAYAGVRGWCDPMPSWQAASNISAVADAARADDLPEIRKLIKEHADVNGPANDGSSALLWAAYHSDVEMTKALLAAGACG